MLIIDIPNDRNHGIVVLGGSPLEYKVTEDGELWLRDWQTIPWSKRRVLVAGRGETKTKMFVSGNYRQDGETIEVRP